MIFYALTQFTTFDTMRTQLEEYSSLKLWTLRFTRTIPEMPCIKMMQGIFRYILLYIHFNQYKNPGIHVSLINHHFQDLIHAKFINLRIPNN